MSFDRTMVRAGASIVAGVALGFLAPMLPAVGASSPATGCAQLTNASARLADARAGILGRISVPAVVQSQLVSAQSRLVGLASQACAITPR